MFRCRPSSPVQENATFAPSGETDGVVSSPVYDVIIDQTPLADVIIPKDGAAPFRMSAFLVAMPTPNGAWSVVAVNYGAL